MARKRNARNTPTNPLFSVIKILKEDMRESSYFFHKRATFATESPQHFSNNMSKTSMSIDDVNIDGGIVTDKQEIANKLNILFQKVSSEQYVGNVYDGFQALKM